MPRDLFAEMEAARAKPRDLFAERNIDIQPKPEPKTRNVAAVLNDTVISVANAALGGVQAAADFVSPGSSFAKAVDELIKKGEESQSDMVKAAREEFQRNLAGAKTTGEEVGAVAKYVAQNPLQAAAQAAGSFAGPGLAIKGATKVSQMLNLAEKTAGRLGLGTGIVTNAAMAGGDAGGSAYKMVMDTPDEILLQNDFIRSQVEKGVPLEKVKEDAANTAARRASFVPALVGGATGAFGVERFLAGVGGKSLSKSTLGGAIKTGLSEALQEGVEEGVTEYSGRAAAQEYDPRIDPTKGVAGAAALGAALGFIPGAGIGAIETRNALAAETAQKELEVQQAQQQAAQSAAAIVPDAQAVQAQAEEAARPPSTIPIGVTTPEQVGAALAGETAKEASDVAQLTGIDAAADQSGAVGAPRELEGAPGGAEALTSAGMADARGLTSQLAAAEGAQPAALELQAKQLYDDYAIKQLEMGVPSILEWDQLGEATKNEFRAQVGGAQDQKVEEQLTYDDGNTYVGATLNGIPEGQGTYTQTDGSNYVGEFKGGQFNGQGTYTFADGYTLTGVFENGKLLNGQGTYTSEDGRTLTSIFENGELISKEEPSVIETTEAIKTKAERKEKAPFTPSKRVIKLEEEKAAPVAEGFTKAQKPFAQAKINTRDAAPKNVDEAISYAGAETAFDEFDAALSNLKTTYAAQIKAENTANKAKYEENVKLGIPSAKPEEVTIFDILGRMTQNERETAFKNAIEATKSKIKPTKKRGAREAFVESLSESQKQAVEAKRKETFNAEVKAVGKLGKKSISDIREARKKAAAAAGTTVAAPKVGKAQPVTTVKVAEKTESERIIERQTVAALRSGDTNSILKAVKTGYTDPATKLFASQIESVLSKLGIKPTVVIGKVEGNRPGMYDPATETITIDPDAPRDAMLDAVVLHEYAHFITDRAVDNPQNLTPIQRVALENLSKLQVHVQKKLGKKYEIGNLKEFLAEAFSNSEFVADMAKIPPLSKVIKVPNALREFAIRVMQLLGIKVDSVSSQVLENLQTMITGPYVYGVREGVQGPVMPGAKTPGRAMGVSFMGGEPKKAEGYAGKSTEEFIEGQKVPERPKGFFGSIKSWFSGGLSGRFKELTRQYQNEQYFVKDLQRQLDRSGLLVLSDEAKANNIQDSVALAPGNFRNLDNTFVNPRLNKINEMLVNMIKETGLSLETVLKRLAAYGEVMHEGEVRAVKYLRKVPLRNDTKNVNWFGDKKTPADVRKLIFDELVEKDTLAKKAEGLGVTTKELAKAYRKLLDDIVADKNNLDPSKIPEHDISHTNYNVLAKLMPEDVKKHIDYFNQNKTEKKMMDDILAEVRALSDVTIMLNKQANYWSPQVDNLVDFYGYKNYVTYKGKPIVDEDADLFYGGEQKLGRELQEKPYTQEGRYTLPDNPILTMMADASIAASRSGRKDITKNLYNLVDTGLVDGKIKIVSFEERYKLKEDPELAKLMNNQNVFLHYMPDGEVAVISVKNDRLRNAIRKTYQTGSGLIDKLNTVTGYMGQTHTRFNVAFAPKNFIRDMLANAFNISVDMSPGAASNYIGSIANYVTSNGFIKSFKVAGAFYEGGADPSKNPRLKKLLANDKSGHVRDLVDYLQNGGDIAYVSSFTAKGQFRDVLALANRPTALGTTLKAKDEVVKFFDQYMAGFEFTSRAAAFKMRKAELVGRFMKDGLSRAEAEKAANKPAAAFAKGLANFEEKGLKGQQMGAWFMFFNASATGAVRVIEPLAPAISSVFGGYQAAADRAWAELPTELRNKGNREEFNKKFIEQAKRGKNSSAAIFGFGVAMYYLAYAGAGEDDFGRNRVAIDDMTRWQRDARFFIGDGVNDIITIPWGFGMGAFAALGAQIASLGNSDTKFTEVMANAVPILMDSFLPLPVSKGSIVEKPGEYIVDTVMPAPLRPIVEFAMNYNSLGQEIYNNRQGPNGSVYTGGDNIPKLFKDAAVFLYESTGFEFGPNEMYFFASAYADALAKAGSATWNIFTIGASDNRPAMERLKQDSLFLSGFIGTRSDYDARMWNKIEKDLDQRKDRLKEMEESNIEAYYNHLEKNPLDEFLVEQYKGDANGELKKLRSEAKEIRRSSDYDFATKRDLLEANRVEQSLLKMQLVDMYKSMGYEF